MFIGLREQQEELENRYLSEYAMKSSESRGRDREIAPCKYRTVFQRDRDRILHSDSFRRLKYKTQMFLSPSGDHFRTRLTHTMEVSQIARTISRALALNEDLTEAIALGHDLGHTPFGHSGERALDYILADYGGFRHYEQSGRVVRYLENHGTGLNLTYEVIDGIEHHTGKVLPSTLEGQVVRYSDRIAYLNHDIQDAIGAGILDESQIPKELLEILGHKHGERIDTMIADCITASMNQPMISLSVEIGDAMNRLRSFMFANVYNRTSDKEMDRRVEHVIASLFRFYSAHMELLPPSYLQQVEVFGEKQAVTDYIAGMTDRYAISQFEKYFVPSPRN